MFTIQKTNKTLSTAIKSYATAQGKLNDKAHVLAVSVIFHAAEHGDVRPLQAFYDTLTVNNQTSFKQYIRRIFTENPQVSCLKYSSKEAKWSMQEKSNEARKALVLMCEEKMINPDGVTFKRFYERENVQEAAILLDNQAVLKRLKSLIAQAKRNDDKVTSTVDSKVLKELETFAQKLEPMATAH